MNKNLHNILKQSINFKKIVHRKGSVLVFSLIKQAYHRKENFKRFLGYEHSYPSYFYIDGNVYSSIDENEEERKKITAQIKKNPVYLMKIAKICQEQGDKLLDFSLKIKKQDLSSESEKELIDRFKEFSQKFMEFITFLMFPHIAETYLSDLIDKNLLKLVKGDMDKYESYHKIIISPIKNNFNFLEKISLLKIAIDLKNKKNISEKLKEHTEKYGVLAVKWGLGKPWNEEAFLSRIKDIKDPEKELKNLLNEKDKIKKEFIEIIKELDIDDELKRIIDITKEYVYLRTFRTDVLSISLGNIHNLLEEIAKRRGLSFDDVNYMTAEEVLNNVKVPKEILEERKKGFCFMGESVLIGKDMEYVKKHFQETVEEVREIKGTMASKGFVKGKVRIVMDNSQLAKVEKGDILVAPMTTPDFVPAMEKAAAFVTDEGGILCHAAIVSREMNKPCIIGTKIATKVLKDGDLVEVDAENGVVRIIKK